MGAISNYPYAPCLNTETPMTVQTMVQLSPRSETQALGAARVSALRSVLGPVFEAQE